MKKFPFQKEKGSNVWGFTTLNFGAELELRDTRARPRFNVTACAGGWETSRVFKYPLLPKEQAPSNTHAWELRGRSADALDLSLVAPSKIPGVKRSYFCIVPIQWTHRSNSQGKALAKTYAPEIPLRQQSIGSRAEQKPSGNIFQLRNFPPFPGFRVFSSLKSKFCRNEGWKASPQQEMRHYSYSWFLSPPHFNQSQITDSPTKNGFSGQKISQEQCVPTAPGYGDSQRSQN